MSYHLVWSDPFHERQSYRDHSEKCVPSLPDRPWDCISHLLYPYSNMCLVLWYLLGSHLLFFGSQKYAASSIWNEFLLAFYIGRILEEKSFVSGMRDVGGLLFTEAFFTVTACCYRNKGQKKKVQQPLQYLLLTLKHWMIDPGRPCGVFQFLCISE